MSKRTRDPPTEIKTTEEKQSRPAMKRNRVNNPTIDCNSEAGYQFYPEFNPLVDLGGIQRRLRKHMPMIQMDSAKGDEDHTASMQIHDNEMFIDRNQVDRCLSFYTKDAVVQSCRQYQMSDVSAAIVNMGLGSNCTYAMQINSVGGGTQYSPMGTSGKEQKPDNRQKVLLSEAFRVVNITWEEFMSRAMDSINITGLLIVQRRSHRFFNHDVFVVRDFGNTTVSVMEHEGQFVYQAWDMQPPEMKSSMFGQWKGSMRRMENSFVFDNFGANPQILQRKVVLTSKVASLLEPRDFSNFMHESAISSEVVNSTPVFVLERPYKVESNASDLAPNTSRYDNDLSAFRASEMYANVDLIDQQRMDRNNAEQSETPVAPLVRTLHNKSKTRQAAGFFNPPEDQTENPLLEREVSTYAFKAPREWTTKQNTPRAYPRSDLTELDKVYQQKVCSMMGTPWEMVFGNQSHIKQDTEQARNTYLRNLRSFLSKVCKPYSYVVNALLKDVKTTVREDEFLSIKDENSGKDKIRKMREDDYVHISIRIPNYNAEDLRQLYMESMIDYRTYSEAMLGIHHLSDYGTTKKELLTKEDRRYILTNRQPETDKPSTDSKPAKQKKATEKERTPTHKEEEKNPDF